MTRHPDKDNGSRGRLWLGMRALATVVAGLACLAATGAGAQTQAGADRYQPERTRADYAQPADSDYDYAAQTLRTTLWLDREEDEVYRRGDEQRVGFQTNEDAYAVVYRIDTDGLVTVLWPRERLDDGFVFGGHEYRLPGRESAALRIDESEGEGYIQAVVSRFPFDLRSLEIDFLQDAGDSRYDFRVAGDPYLAMNEVNFAVTGLEDSGEAVITNHVRYYVHKRVDHPRYLCAQCHTEDSPRYDPYAGRCTLDVDRDYTWANRWYTTYGYYPVYWNPVYVYVDPWTWRPWVNFWYDPWYVCAPYNGWGGSYWDCYTWNYSPYYNGGCGSYWENGGRRFHPLNRHGDGVAVRKAYEYDAVTRQVAHGAPGNNLRDAMVTRRPLPVEARKGPGVAKGSGVASRGDGPLGRSSERFPVVAGQGGGVRIHGVGRPKGDGAVAQDAAKPSRRHTAGGGATGPRLAPVSQSELRGGGARGGDAGSGRDGAREGVRSLDSRSRGTRVWNSTTGRSGQQTERVEHGERQARPRQQVDGERRSEQPATAPAERPRRPSGDRPGSTAPERRESGTRSQPDNARSGRESVRPGKQDAPAATPAPSKPAETRRQDAPRSRGSDQKDNAKSSENATRRAPADGRK